MTRRVFAFGIAGLTTLRAETPSERAKKILEKTIYAMGGDAFKNMRTRVESGRAYSFYREQLTGLAIARISTKYLAPNGKDDVRQLQRQVYGKKQDDAVLYTGNDAFEVTFRGAKPFPEDKLRQARESTLHDVFYILRQRMDEPGMSCDATSAADVVENQPVDTLDIYDAANRRVTVWIHSSTHLPVKQRFYRVDDVTKQRREEVTRYTKYRDVGDGVMWPYDVQRERDTEKVFEMYSDHVKVNEQMDDKLFDLPNGIKVLPRDKPFVA